MLVWRGRDKPETPQCEATAEMWQKGGAMLIYSAYYPMYTLELTTGAKLFKLVTNPGNAVCTCTYRRCMYNKKLII